MSMVSVIMATYNGEKYVGAQIDSILASSFQDFQLFIYDDGSKDGTVAILKEYAKEYPDKIHIHQNEQNLGVTLNFLSAACRTTTDFVMFCDQDDVWKPNKIAVTLKRMRHLEGSAGKTLPIAVFTDAEVVDQDLNQIHESFFQSGGLDPRKTGLPHLLMENKLIGCTVMFNAALRKILQSTYLPKEAKYHDGWIGLIAASLGKIGYVRESTLLYRQHGGNVVGNKGFSSYVLNRISTISKQKASILALERQAKEFYGLYGSLLTRETGEIIKCFSRLEEYGFVSRRMKILHYGFFKTGLIRNIGLMFII